MHGADGLPPRKEPKEPHNKVVYEGKRCKRCGIILLRKFVRNSEGRLSCIGWEQIIREKTR
jgi:hypothetical protein